MRTPRVQGQPPSTSPPRVKHSQRPQAEHGTIHPDTGQQHRPGDAPHGVPHSQGSGPRVQNRTPPDRLHAVQRRPVRDRRRRPHGPAGQRFGWQPRNGRTAHPPDRSLIGHDVYSFSLPANTKLEPNTKYWIVVKGNGNGWFHATTGAAPARGWKLADEYDYRSKYRYAEDGTQSVNTATEFHQFQGNLSLRINRLNNVATGQLTISGTPETQQTLTAVATIEDDDGGVPTKLDYQWLRYSADGTTFETNIGTNSSEYTLVLADEGKKIRVQISFVDGKDNDEGPLTSDAYPASYTITAPTSYTMVSNIHQMVDNDRSVQISTGVHAQAFTTSGETTGYILNSVTVVSIDPEGDRFTVKVCDVDNPTRACTDLTPPASFTAGPLVFKSPSDRTITLARATTYALTFRVAAGTTVTLPATAEDNEDPISLPGWSIRNKSQYLSDNQWTDRGYDVAYLIAIKGELSQLNPTSGRPAITGNPSVGQVLTATTDHITTPEGVVGNFSYQWRRLSATGVFEADVGANSNRYTLTTHDLNKKFQVEVSFVDTAGRVVGFLTAKPEIPDGPHRQRSPINQQHRAERELQRCHVHGGRPIVHDRTISPTAINCPASRFSTQIQNAGGLT